MSAINDDLIDGEVNPLAAELRAANAKIEQLVQMHRHYTELFAKVAQAAGVHLNGSLEGVVDAVIAKLNVNTLTAPLEIPSISPRSPEVPGSGPTCEVCGEQGAVDFDGETLCANCSGENALAEGVPI